MMCSLLLRHDPKLGIFAADCAFQVSEYPQLTGKLLANRQIWATRALAIADNDIANFDWIPKALCTLAYYQENNGLIEMANQTYLKAISLTERQSPPRLFSICLLHLKRAIILGELKQYDEEILSFENAKGTWVKLREGSGKDFLRKQLERALTKSVQAAKLRNES